MTYDVLVELALALPDVVEEPYYGGPSVKRGKRWMFSLKDEGASVAIKLDWEDHDRLLKAHPSVIYKTPHYEGYPAFLVRLDTLTLELARELVELSWEDAPKKARTIRH